MILRKKNRAGINGGGDGVAGSSRLPLYKPTWMRIRHLILLSVIALVMVDLFGLPHVRLDDSNRYWSVTGARDVQAGSDGSSHGRVIFLPLDPPLTSYARNAAYRLWGFVQRNMYRLEHL